MCDNEYEIVSYVLCECPVYDSLKMTIFVSCGSFLGKDLNALKAWIVLKKHLLFCCERSTLILWLILLIDEGTVCRLRCLQGKADTTLSCACTYVYG